MTTDLNITVSQVHSFKQDKHGFDGMERVILTANGNLQRIMSAFYDAPVYVHIVKNHEMESDPQQFLRTVRLKVFPGEAQCTFGVAFTRIRIEEKSILNYYHEAKPSIGQLFSHLHVQPSFNLEALGRNYHTSHDSGGVLQESDDIELLQTIRDREWYGKGDLWRHYQLKAPSIQCDIVEVLREDLFRLTTSIQDSQ